MRQKLSEFTLYINILRFKVILYFLNLKMTEYLLLSTKLSSAIIKNENGRFCQTFYYKTWMYGLDYKSTYYLSERFSYLQFTES